jgi:hypothetical protein
LFPLGLPLIDFSFGAAADHDIVTMSSNSLSVMVARFSTRSNVVSVSPRGLDIEKIDKDIDFRGNFNIYRY